MVSDEVAAMMLDAGEQTAESAAGSIVRDALDAPRPAPVTYEERWVSTGWLDRGYRERRVVFPEVGEWERVQG